MSLYSSLNLFFIKLFTMLVPRWLHAPFALFWGTLFYLLTPRQRRGMRANLRIVTGRRQVERLLIASYYKYARNWCDVMLMIQLRGDRLQALIGQRSSGKALDDALAKGSGAILVSPHFGNWELGGLGLADLGYKLHVMTFPEPDAKVNQQREQVRTERGIGVIYVDRHDTSPLAVIEAVNALRRNEIICLIGDRDGSSNTVQLDFFGQPTDIPVGAAYLAMATGAPVLPVFVPLLPDGRYATLMDEPIFFQSSHGHHRQSIKAGMEQLVAVFERYIRQYPDQWYNFFDFWADTSRKKRIADE
ncbi:lysophospholipid acyltransferase family protein [Trichlorobacter lovleyi]|uniref:Lipid A biosynthesis acyltransferase n=1 Tax=Trichlorobacter lovleyi (strain ATCC BAA-1151 / DSM 17278 / SZ) TaxID=398767 RepID=B3E4A2_TRIL1|nr:lysophospholipid acyltransferase family protein [Trichlorobacter lovleyi]ACD95923.1 lipid A biosynthesis acyltransferase [Trichlorobacter lovleyi SZ]